MTLEIVYRKGKFGIDPMGDLTDVRVGEQVRYMDDNHASQNGRVSKVNIKAGVLRTEPHEYNGYVLQCARTLKFDQVLDLKREASDKTSSIMDIVHPLPDQPPDPMTTLPPHPSEVPPEQPKKKSLLTRRKVSKKK